MLPTAIELTRQFLAINSINPPGLERNLAHKIGSLLTNHDFKVSYYEFEEKRTSLVAVLPGSGAKKPLCFSGHLDTVPLGSSRWNYDPFAGEISGGKIYGRGAADMKSGLAAIIWAAMQAAKLKQRQADITLIFTASEETACQGARFLASKCILKEAGALILAEPTANIPKTGHKGTLWLRVKCSGVTAHGSMPQKGENAIYKAAAAILKIKNHQFDYPDNPSLGKNTINVGTISGGSNVNVVPDETSFTLDIRLLPGQDHNDMLEEVKAVMGNQLDISVITHASAIGTDPKNIWVQEVFQIMEPLLGHKLKPGGISYVTDASVLTPALGNPPTIIMGPGEPESCHTTDEFCFIDKIDMAALAYLKIIKRWCN